MKILLFLLFFIVAGCSDPADNLTPPDLPGLDAPAPSPDSEEPVKPEEQKRSRQVDCHSIGEAECDKQCQSTCDSLFPRATREKCYLLKKKLVKSFEDIVIDVKMGITGQLNQPALHCLLDLDPDPFIESIKDMSVDEAKGFLKEIAKDFELANVLYSVDSELKIIKTLLKEASQTVDLVDSLNTALDSSESQTFLWLSADKRNKSAFKWLENYVENRCQKSKADCPGFSQMGVMGAYCHALLKEKNLQAFLSSANLFEKQYKGDVEKAGYEYKVADHNWMWHESLKGDFRDFCKIETKLTEGERKWQEQLKHFGEATCKANLKPFVHVEAWEQKSTDEVSSDVATETNGLNGLIRSAFLEVDIDQINSSQYVWNHGNLFGVDKLKGVGDTYWYLDKDKKIITNKINTEFNIEIQRGQSLSLPEEVPLKDPKAEKVRRAFVMLYVPDSQNLQKDLAFPGCVGSLEASMDKCPHSYCLLDYELDGDNLVKTCEVIKCALGRPQVSSR